ncbi:MAG TPA: amino acid ABC transporter substrate-binding protein [Pseudonocardiaceae bacterium]|jgi:branched-chain amino acid transport system substrate-binding protein|nr:amino acid ABC transporter substrate-binding protein [Pseudonocardiaceae bacterium]
MRDRICRARTFALLLIVATLVLAACGSGGKTSATGPLTIGISLSLTGDFADSGTAAEHGYQLWADSVNAQGGLLGRQVSLKIVDDASSPNQAVSNYQTLITRDRVDLVLGPFSSLLTIPTSQIAARYGYAFLEPAGGGPQVFAAHLHNLFFVQPAPAVQQGDVFADYLLSLPADQRPRTAAYPALDDPFASPIADEVRTRLEAAGIRTVYQQIYPAETADLTPVVAAMAAKNPDVVVGGTQSDDAFAMVKAMLQLKWAPHVLYLSNGANSPSEFPDKVGAANVNGIFSSGDWFSGAKVADNAAFIAAYTKKYGGTANDIDSTSAEAYSCGQLLSEVAAKTGKIDNATIISTLHSGAWSTLEGNLSWNAEGAAHSSYVLVEWLDGQMTAVYPAASAVRAPQIVPILNRG